MYNLNISRKNDRNLNGNLIDESISIFGIPCLWLYSERVQENPVFNDFNHFDFGDDYKQVTLTPLNAENFDGGMEFNQFGMFQAFSIELIISAPSLLKIYPNYLKDTGARSKVVNSIIQTPASQLLEITSVTPYDVGVNNQFSYADNPSSYKLTCRVYTPNLADELDQTGEVDLNTKLNVDNFTGNTEETFTEINDFFDSLEVTKEEQNKATSTTGGVFGSLG